MSVLVLSDHDAAATRIARALSGGTDKRSQPPKPPIHTFERGGTVHHVIGLDGPLTEIDYPAELRNWQRTDLRDLVHADPRTRLRPANTPIIETLRALAAETHQVVVATRNDLDGELVAADAVDILRAAHDDLPLVRARFSAMTKAALDAALQDVDGMDPHRIAAARTRRQTDLAWTAVLTRFVALAGNARPGAYLRLGRLESATLALLAAREREIQSFVPDAYWEVVASIAGASPFDAVHTRGRFDTAADAQRTRKNAASAGDATVVTSHSNFFSEESPPALDADAFQRHASRDLGMTAAQAMEVADRLFLEGYTTDPRTAGTAYAPTTDVDAILKVVAKMPEYRDLVKEFGANRQDAPGRKPADGGPPLHPVQSARQTDLPKDEWDVYDLVVRHFLASLAPAAEGEDRVIRMTIGPETFEASASRITRPGWRRHYPFPVRTDVDLPGTAPGDALPVGDVKVVAKETQPPARYDSANLLRTMQKRGLGTATTRPAILRRLSERKYTKNPPRFEPTEMTVAVMDAFERHASILTDPARVARLDTAIQAVADGERSMEDVIDESRRMLDEALVALEESQDELAADLREALRIQERVGRCPTCGRDLVIRRARKTGKRFIGCSGWPDCKQSYPLPQGGYLEPLDTACDACGAPEMRLTKRGRRPWEFCANMDCPKREERDVAQRHPEPAAEDDDQRDATASASAGD